MQILVGTSGFGYKEWVGKFYPPKTPPKEMLRFYGERFNTVEVNNTFYRMPKEDVLRSWADQVPEDFVFALKAPQVITHFKRLRDVGPELDYFFSMVSVLGRRLGPVLFQFPGSFHGNGPLLKEFLALLPGELACAFEFRHPSWLQAGMLDLLRAKGCSLCLADTDENPAGEIISTAPWGYLRLRRTDYTEAGLAMWRETIQAQTWERVFVFFKHEEEAKGPETARRFSLLGPS